MMDIEALAPYFLKTFTNKTNKKINTISKAYLEALNQHSSKSKIRELKNIIERSVILTDGSLLTEDNLPLDLQLINSSDSKEKTLSSFELSSAEKIHSQKVLNYTNGN